MMTEEGRKSIREQLEQHREEFGKLKAAGKVSAEMAALFHAMYSLMQLIMTLLFERHTPKSSANSSFPSAAIPFDEGAKSRPGARSKGPKMDEEPDPHTRTEVTEESIEVTHCQDCGEDLCGVEPFSHEERVLVDIEIVTRERRFRSEAKRCPACRAVTRGPFPEHLSGPLQYGNGVIAMAIDFLIAQMVPLRRTAQVLHNMTGRSIAEATLSKWVMRVHRALDEWERRAIEMLLEAPVMHADETSIRVNRKKHWIHVCSAGDLVVKKCHPKRGEEALRAFDIIPRFGDRASGDEEDAKPVLVHDRWATYFLYDRCSHALCGSHLVRNLQHVIDASAPCWAQRMQQLLIRTCHAVNRSGHGILGETRFGKVSALYDAILEQGRAELPPRPPRKSSRGQAPKSEAEKLHRAFVDYKNEILRFARQPEVPFTNNRSERDLRMAKTKQKVSGTFRSALHAQAYCRISSYLQSAARHSVGPLAAIRLALQGRALELLDSPE